MPKLMIPGPVAVEDDVLQEMGAPVRAHYGKEWTAIYSETRSLLKEVFNTSGDVHILVGSGSSGLDAAIGSLTAHGDTAIVGTNGFFGDRLIEICAAYGLTVVPVEASLGEPLRASDFEAALSQATNAALVVAVYVETATSVVNPIEEIASVVRKSGVPMVVDAVSALGGVPLEMDAWDIDICVSASQKCLGAPPGLAPVAISPRAWEVMDSKPGRGWYLNLQTWRRFSEEWGAWHPFPVTMATNNVMALRASLKDLLADGIDSRIAHYTELALRLRNGVRDLGLQPLTPDDRLAPVLTAVLAPQGIDSARIVRYLLEEHGIKISGGLGEGLSHTTFRVGHMGAKTNPTDIDEVLEGLSGFLRSPSAAA
ncbi:MAG: alanine--glyoxylate aminotransferase family protein [Anaerolineae bacterium]|nr:MAG: alanine--glyoxylate aminotransferase family protein [Anaerolineae bacterium]